MTITIYKFIRSHSNLCFIPCLFFCLIFNNILRFFLSPYPSCSLSQQHCSFIRYSKLFLYCCWCTFLYCFFWLLLEFLIFKYLINSFVSCFTHFLIVFLFYYLILFKSEIDLLCRRRGKDWFAVGLLLRVGLLELLGWDLSLWLGWRLGWRLDRFLLFLYFIDLICPK